MSKTISSFNQVEVSNDLKTLILCDIDDTILHFPDCDTFCENLIKEFRTKHEEYEDELKKMKNYYKKIMRPTHTDYDGFDSMIKKLNGKLMFLTSRNLEGNIWTKNQLKQIGLLPDDFEIHYTGEKISKGEYIERYIDLSGWENVIFIDDYDSYIKSVKDIYPQIICYKFYK
jgi:hypothetical protein